jgi:adenosine deaminase
MRVDLHRHLDGNVRAETVWDLACAHGIDLPADGIEAVRELITIRSPRGGLMEFLEKFHWPMQVLADLDACRRIAIENVEDAARERLDHVELRFSPAFMARAHQLPLPGVVEAVIDGIREGLRTHPIPLGVIGVLSRTFGVESALRELEALLTQREALAAIDLAGDEARFPARMFEEHFRKVRRQGLGITIHAGEADGPRSVYEALTLCGADRIGHGIRSVEDPELLDLLRQRQIPLECCITSNVQTSVVASAAAHPIRHLLENGIRATINTDDPGISGIDLDHELTIAAPQAGLTPAHITLAADYAAAARF